MAKKGNTPDVPKETHEVPSQTYTGTGKTYGARGTEQAERHKALGNGPIKQVPMNGRK